MSQPDERQRHFEAESRRRAIQAAAEARERAEREAWSRAVREAVGETAEADTDTDMSEIEAEPEEGTVEQPPGLRL